LLKNISPNKSLFRQSALNHSQNTTTQSALVIVKPAAWLFILCALCFLIALTSWGWFGKVELTTPALGIIVADKDFKEAEKLLKDNIMEHQEKLATLYELFIRQKQLYSNHYITINELERTRQDYLNAKEQLAVLSRQNVIALVKPLFHEKSLSNNPTMDSLLFVSHNAGKKIKPGMNVYVLPNTITAYEYGYLRGEVLDISEYPVTKETVNSYLGNMSLIDEFFQGGAPFMVKVRLTANTNTPSGLAWTSPTGPDFKVEAGTTVTARIVNRITAPVSLITTHRYG
jgi:HlyD family secretion protein